MAWPITYCCKYRMGLEVPLQSMQLSVHVPKVLISRSYCSCCALLLTTYIQPVTQYGVVSTDHEPLQFIKSVWKMRADQGALFFRWHPYHHKSTPYVVSKTKWN